jgi:endonuclease/exonuclease/phosphatase family metal-dependent hydrolase
MRLLFWNIGYARHLDGSPKEWLQNGYQVFFHPKKHQVQQLDRIVEVVKNISPDVFTYVEILTGAFRNQHFNQQHYLTEKLGCLTANAECKYNQGLLTQAPFHVGNANGTCAVSEARLEAAHLRSGGKTLVQKTILNDWVIFTVHLSLLFSTRKKQLEEVESMVMAVPESYNVVVCGDFNVLRGNAELEKFLLKTGLVLNANLHHTFPAYNPTFHLDHILYRLRGDTRASIEILPIVISDHRPVLCTFSS